MQLLKKLFSFRGLLALFFLALTFQIIAPDTAFAASSDKGVLESLAELLGVFISVLTFIALLMMKFFGQLMGTSMLTGPEAMQSLTPMWVWVRNLTNILFVIVLVGLAFSNLYASFSGENGGNWDIKTKLPKVIIALVVINFSLLGFKVVIDAVNVGTVAILGIADSRLDADNPEQQDAMIHAKTWITLPKNSYDKLKGKVTFNGDKDSVKAGASCSKEHKEQIGTGDGVLTLTKSVDGKTRYYACRDFRSQVNDLFCAGWEKEGYNDPDTKEENLNDDCLFVLKKSTFKSLLSPDDEPGQNLFMSFGTTFMHLEKLPALAAKINNLNGVILNTLFSAVLSIAYVVALAAIFIALLSRIIILWIAMVFSPLLIAISIMGFEGGSNITSKLLTNLIMPLKIAAAFAVGFVMMSGMIEFDVVQQGDAFLFGPALSNLGIEEYGFLWQIATIVLFWKVAGWALEGNEAEFITKQIFSGAEALGTVAARAATIDRQIFSVGTGSSDKKFSMSNILSLPTALSNLQRSKQAEGLKNLREALHLEASEMDRKILSKKFDADDHFDDFMKFIQQFKNRQDFEAHKSQIIDMLKRSSNAPWAGDLLKSIEKNGLVKGVDKYATSSEGRRWTKDSEYNKLNKIYDADFFKGTTSDTGEKEDKDSAKNDEKSSVGFNDHNEEFTFGGNRSISFEDAGKVISGNLGKKSSAALTMASGKYDAGAIAKLVEESGKSEEVVVEKLLDLGANVNGMMKSDKNNSIVSENIKGNQKNVAYLEKDGNKVQAVYIADRKSGVPIDLKDFGGGSDGKVDKASVNNVIVKVNNADDSKFTNLGMTKDQLLDVLEKIEGAKASQPPQSQNGASGGTSTSSTGSNQGNGNASGSSTTS